ncbi:MAG: creatininase family protein [Verrucomicrobia bacterium]|nr:MAG: creatininase family protein [Verrucomicrobiota bacterium]
MKRARKRPLTVGPDGSEHLACHNRYLPAMSLAEIEALPSKHRAVVVIPTGSVEQHGPHLPLGMDTTYGLALMRDVCEFLPARAPIYLAPSINYGISDEHLGFPGTISLSPQTFRRLLLASARQIHDLGFRTIAVLRTHGGNSATIIATLREIQTTLHMNACMIAPKWRPPLDEREAEYGIHAGHFETAMMLATVPHLVRMERAVAEYPPASLRTGEVRAFKGPAALSWTTADVSRSGVIGDPRGATEAEGREWFKACARSLAEELLRLVTEARRK